ncbi:hypothetical protein [Actinoplanes solisilvae]|uniref:hypothetical protein n=1 Tax=Actinoplanes solisilvae TaxID=2486853 RepID=UPI000FDC7021|nr:hypothetical protein [Actinoplanes solisilvae]
MEIIVCAGGILVAAVVSWLVNQLPVLKVRSTSFRVLIALVVVALCVTSGLIIRYQISLDEIDKPLAVITSPSDGARIDRPQEVAVELRKALPKGHSLWLAYQNELGGPVIVQAAKCQISRTSADCGPLWVGHDEHDRAAFKLLLVVADAGAGAVLRGNGPATGGDGDNKSWTALPDGVERVSVARRVVLKDRDR